MPALEVLPSALAATAHEVRAFAHEVGKPVQGASFEAPVLAEAWAVYAARWTAAAVLLADDAGACAAALRADAEHYRAVESLLVPRALR